VTVTGPTSAGDLRIFRPVGAALVSVINYGAGRRANNGVSTLGPNGIAVRCEAGFDEHALHST
jgi:hypothetical protein